MNKNCLYKLNYISLKKSKAILNYDYKIDKYLETYNFFGFFSLYKAKNEMKIEKFLLDFFFKMRQN